MEQDKLQWIERFLSLMKILITSVAAAKMYLPVKCWICQSKKLIQWHVKKLCKYMCTAMPLQGYFFNRRRTSKEVAFPGNNYNLHSAMH